MDKDLVSPQRVALELSVSIETGMLQKSVICFSDSPFLSFFISVPPFSVQMRCMDAAETRDTLHNMEDATNTRVNNDLSI
jgi:hypothetical protein